MVKNFVVLSLFLANCYVTIQSVVSTSLTATSIYAICNVSAKPCQWHALLWKTWPRYVIGWLTSLAITCSLSLPVQYAYASNLNCSRLNNLHDRIINCHKWSPYCKIVHTTLCINKRHPIYLLNYSVTHQRLLTRFGKQLSDATSYRSL